MHAPTRFGDERDARCDCLDLLGLFTGRRSATSVGHDGNNDGSSDGGRAEAKGPGDIGAAAADLLAWYDRHRRRLPWRAAPARTPIPTGSGCRKSCCSRPRSRQSRPYYARFLERFPTVSSLGGGAARGCAQAVGGARLLRPRPQPACLRQAVCDHMPGSVSRQRSRARGAARDRALYRRGDRRDRLRCHAQRRSTAMSNGWSRASMRSRRPAGGQADDPRSRSGTHADAPGGRFRPGDDGPRRHHLHAEQAGLLALSVEPTPAPRADACDVESVSAQGASGRDVCVAARHSSSCARTGTCSCGRDRPKGCSAA